MSKRLLLPQDPRWFGLVERFAGDIAGFSMEVRGQTPSFQQMDLFSSVSVSRSRTSVASGHGTGKTTALATIVWWHLVCHEQSVTLVTANDLDQLKATLWKEIGKAEWEIKNGPFGWLTDYVEILADNRMRVIGFEDTWFVESKTADEKNANKMAGRHGEWLLIIVDEASTLPNAVLTTLSGALTEEHNRMLLTSQYTENAGFFHETQTTLSESNGGVWTNLRFSSLDSPWVDNPSIKMLWDMYDDDERRVRILGLPPANSSDFMMNLKVAEAMYKRGRIIKDDENYGWFVCADIASGEGLRDKSAIPVIRVIGYGDYGPDARRVEVVEIPLHVNNIRSNVFSGYVADAGASLSNVTYLPDAGGLGVNVCQDLEDMGKVVIRVLWGQPCFKGMNAERYLNKRAQAMHHAARAAKEGRLSILTPEYRRVMLDQSSRIPKRFSGNRSKMVVPPKGSPEWKGLKSPDLWDAVCFAFLENAEYMPADKSTKGIVKNQGDQALEDAAALFDSMGG